MPEGPEMRRAAAELDAVLRGRRVANAWFRFPHLRNAGRRLSGERVRGVRARGKALIVDFANGESIYTHNQLYGKWLVGPAGERPDTNRELRLALETRAHAALLYSASEIEVLATGKLERHAYVRKLGIELLDDATTLAQVRAQLDQPRFAGQRLGALLLDQGFLAGIGNYLRSEILFVAKLHPDERLGALDGKARQCLARASLAITRRAYRTGGITNAPSIAKRLKSAGLPYDRYRHYVFDRDTEPCHSCATRIRRIIDAGRQLYLCMRCQGATPWPR
ncbi:MAG: endonuclease VIII [Steroidobacteraceae bacterium]